MHENNFITTDDSSSALLLSESMTEIPEEKVEPVFGIRIGNMGFLVSKNRYCEVLDKVQVNALPNVHPWVSGILNLRGNLVPVFDLCSVLDEVVDNKKRRLLAVDRGEKAVALWIDSFPEIKNRLTMQPAKRIPELPDLLKRFVTNIYEQNSDIWLDVEFEGLFKTLGRHQFETEEMSV
jgi:twitching motility protein PilI